MPHKDPEVRRAWKAAYAKRTLPRRRERERERLANEPEYRERERARLRAYYHASKDKQRARRRRYRERYPEKARAKGRRDARASVEARRRAADRRRARKIEAYVEDVHRLVVLERDDGVCGICGEDVDPLRFEVDHIVPLSLGGLHNYENAQPSHKSCNSRKGGSNRAKVAA